MSGVIGDLGYDENSIRNWQRNIIQESKIRSEERNRQVLAMRRTRTRAKCQFSPRASATKPRFLSLVPYRRCKFLNRGLRSPSPRKRPAFASLNLPQTPSQTSTRFGDSESRRRMVPSQSAKCERDTTIALPRLLPILESLLIPPKHDDTLSPSKMDMDIQAPAQVSTYPNSLRRHCLPDFLSPDSPYTHVHPLHYDPFEFVRL